MFWEIMTLGMNPYEGLDEVGILKRIKEGYRLPQRSAAWVIPNEVRVSVSSITLKGSVTHLCSAIRSCNPAGMRRLPAAQVGGRY